MKNFWKIWKILMLTATVVAGAAVMFFIIEGTMKWRATVATQIPCQPPAEAGATIVDQGIEMVWDSQTCQYLIRLAPTPFPVLVTPTPLVAAIPVSAWTPYESEGGIPYSGTTWATDVAPDEIEVLTAGPACIAGVCLPGGVDRGTIIIMLPASDVVVHYTVTGLIAGSNWHGSYRPIDNPAVESTWRNLAEDRIKAMQIAPNCTSGKGCVTIDVLVIGSGNKVVAQWVVGQ